MGLYNEARCRKLRDALITIKISDFRSQEYFRMRFLDEAAPLLSTEHGLDELMLLAPRFDECLLFLGRPWENPATLNPALIKGTLAAGGNSLLFETLSNLRMLSIALGRYHHPAVTAEAATDYLHEAVAQNMDSLFPGETEEARITGGENQHRISLLFSYLYRHISPSGLLDKMTEETEKLAVQRPIMADRILDLITTGKRLCGDRMPESFKVWAGALAEVQDWSKLKSDELQAAAEEMGKELKRTGLVSPRSASLLVYLNIEKQKWIPMALGLSPGGRERYERYQDFIPLLITKSVTPRTRQAVYGLSCLLERDQFTDELVAELKEVVKAKPCWPMANKVKEAYGCGDDSIQSLLVSGMVCLLGQPLGIGQGHNPTCQSTRALSYWAQRNPIYLLKLYGECLVQGWIVLEFEGYPLSSAFLAKGELNLSVPLDPVSLILVPHLDAIYGEMLRRASYRLEDVHKWVNPAFYQIGVLDGFADRQHPDFLKLFYTHYHPENQQLQSQLPQPAGITIYDSSGKALGAHAILIQRIAHDEEGSVRVYFYNPNNDSQQTWGKDMVTSVTGYGEKPGEASLHMDQFAFCLYAFHYPME
jgi:hypothetical protein